MFDQTKSRIAVSTLAISLFGLAGCRMEHPAAPEAVHAQRTGQIGDDPDGKESAQPLPFPEFRGQPETVREAVSGWVGRGDSAIPELKKGIDDPDARVRRACREALAKITGQWGWDDGLNWRHSLAEAQKDAEASGKPIMLLQLFGRFDEEFC